MATLPGLRIGVSLDSSTFIAETRRVNDSVNRMGRSVAQQNTQMQRGFTAASRAVRTLSLSLAGLVTGVGIVGLARLVRGAIDTADALGKTADKVGVTVTQLQELRLAGERVGASQRTLDLAIQRFSRRTGEAAQGTGELLKTVQQYNIQLRDTDGNLRPVVDVLRDYAEVTKNAQGPQEQLRLAFKAFDSEGAVLVNLLREGAAGIDRYAAESERLGQVTDEQARAAARANDALTNLNTTISTNLTRSIAAAAPQVEGLAFVLERAFKATRDFFEELNARGAEKLNFEIAGINAEMAKLLELRDEAAKSGAGQLGFDPLGGTVARDLDEQIAALREQRDALIRSRDSLERLGKAQQAVAASAQPAIEAISETGDAAGDAAGAVAELTAQQQRLAQAGAILLETSALEERFDRDADAAARLNAEQESLAAKQEQLRRDRERDAQRQAQQSADRLAAPFETFIRNAQSETADFWTEFYEGGIKSAEDVTEAIKHLFTRLAGELTALAIFQPEDVFGSSGLLSGFFGNGQQAGGAGRDPGGGPGGMIPPAASGSGSDFSGVLGGGLAGVGAGTTAGGAVGDPQAAAIGSAVGAVIGGIIGSYTVVGAPVGAFIGGTLGGLAGGAFAGSKGDKEASFSGTGGLGGLSGAGQVGSFLTEVDRNLRDILNSRQQALVNAALKKTSVSVIGADFDPAVQAFAASQRIGPAARALGFDARAITGRGQANAQAQLQNLQTALQVQRAIEDLTGAVSTFDRQTEDMAIEIEDLTARAKRFGISIDGLAAAQDKRADALSRQQDAAVLSVLDPFEALAGELEAFQKQLDLVGLTPGEQFRLAQEDFRRIAAEAAGGSTTALQQLDEAGALFIAAADRIGASPAAARAQDEVKAAIQSGLEAVRNAQDNAAEGFADVVERARRDIVDSLQELIQVSRDELAALKRAPI